ncbi:serine protease [Paraburkholderia kirstenboschensis]|uniref:serine protease n=1 Tax=Paraburkholderia kirstenboschensis TaxID=1245436 RepID=UPI000A407AD4|nr:serine protease [Paraburkholderia kirstenboschensis]
MFDDEAIKRATASVFDRDGFCGTAWLGAPGFAITAAHVVADLAARKPKAMTFKLLFFDTPVSGSLNATNIDYFHDVAVLSIAQEGLLADVHPIPIAASTEVRAGQDWTAYGPADGHPRGLWLREQIISLAGWTEDGAPAIQLVTRQAAAEHLRGMSGAPVLVNGAAIAILREFPVRMPGEHVLLASRLDAAARSLPTLAGLIDAGNRSRKQQSASTFDGYCRRVIRKWDEIAYQGMFAFDTPRSSFPPLETIYVRQPFRREMTPSRAPRGTVVCDSENTSIESSLQHHRNILVQGDAGSGKTSMLRHVCIQLASDWVVQMQHRFLPVYVSAQSLVVANRGGSLEDRIRDAVAIDIGMSMERDFRQALPEGASWLLIIDGLDEIVRSDQRRLLIDQIMLEANDQAEAKHLLVSSRPIVDLHTSLGEEQFSRFTLVPFDRTQALNLVDRWFAFDRAPSTSAGFLRMIDESALKGILETPVLLTMALLSYLGGQVNGYCTRVELYDRFIEGTLDAARMRTGLNNVSSAWAELFGSEGERAALTLQRGRRELLRELAMHQQFQGNDRTIGMRKLFDICVARGWFAASLCDGFEKRRIINSLLPEALLQSGLVRLTPDSLQFTHNTIREFLCAELLVRQHPIESEVAQNVLNQWGDARWREVVLSSLSIWSSEKARSSVMFSTV